MMGSDSGMERLKEKWLQDLVEQVGNQLNARKMMETLTSKIDKDSNEIAYVKDRLVTLQNELERTEETVREVQRRMFDSKDLLTSLEAERKSAEDEYSRFLAARDVEGIREDLSKLESQISKYNENIRLASNRFLLMQSNCQEGMRQRKGLEEKCVSLEEELMRIDQEIEVSRTTISLIMGKRPESFDEETFREIQGDMEENIGKITRELVEETEKARNQVASIKKQTDKNQEEKKSLLSEKAALQEKVDRLRIEIGENKSREAVEFLRDDVSKLKAQNRQFAGDVEQKKHEIDHIEPAIEKVIEQLEREKERERDSTERYEYLKALKEEISSLPNVADEVERLEIEIKSLKRDSKVNQSLNDIIKELNSEVGLTTDKLKSSFKEYELLFENFEAQTQNLITG